MKSFICHLVIVTPRLRIALWYGALQILLYLLTYLGLKSEARWKLVLSDVRIAVVIDSNLFGLKNWKFDYVCYHEKRAAHEYFATCSLSLNNFEIISELRQRLKQFYFSFRRGYMWNKYLANAKRPCDCSVLCLHPKCSLCSCPHTILNMTLFSSTVRCRDRGRNGVQQQGRSV